jgi:hypothetical protein
VGRLGLGALEPPPPPPLPLPRPLLEVVQGLPLEMVLRAAGSSYPRRVDASDDKLKAVFGKAQVSMFEMAGLIGNHLS